MSCRFCELYDFSKIKAKVENGKYASIVFAGGSHRYPVSERFKYCPVCGARLKYEGNSKVDIDIIADNIIIDGDTASEIEDTNKFKKYYEKTGIYNIKSYIFDILHNGNVRVIHYDRLAFIMSEKYGIEIAVDIETNELMTIYNI